MVRTMVAILSWFQYVNKKEMVWYNQFMKILIAIIKAIFIPARTEISMHNLS